MLDTLVPDFRLPGNSDPGAEFARPLASLDELERLAQDMIRESRSGAVSPERLTQLQELLQTIGTAEEYLKLRAEFERERHENAVLQEVSMRLSSAAEIRDVLRAILESLRNVVDFDAAGIFVFNKEMQQIEVDMLAGYGSSQRRRVYTKFQEGVKQGEGIVATVVFSGKPLYVPDVREDPRYVQVRPTTLSELAVPILVRDELIGAFNLESNKLDAFSDRDLRTLMTFASHAGVALERARADRERQHTQRIGEELALARRIHTSFLPKVMPRFSPYDLGGMNFPSSEVGGDYYDFVPITDDDLGIIMSDVAGHGVAAALLMANFRACIRIESRAHYAIEVILKRVNEFLVETNPPDSFVTAFYGVLNRKYNVLTFANAGHNPPLLYRKGEPPRWLSNGGPILGVLPDAGYQQDQIELIPGDVLLLYTDGVTETKNDADEEFGEDRLAELVEKYSNLTAHELARRISHDVHLFHAPDATMDDLTLSVVKYEPTA
ncbi:MAG: SpoIIE family protein phosphatase [Calditrichaeota bacterium]|nr:SpoIIE family protein phosphatase [Calditrichota bacterium]MCB9368737.1 SpoIIE family protein phosphatase [Calditrichota bacterium]